MHLKLHSKCNINHAIQTWPTTSILGAAESPRGKFSIKIQENDWRINSISWNWKLLKCSAFKMQQIPIIRVMLSLVRFKLKVLRSIILIALSTNEKELHIKKLQVLSEWWAKSRVCNQKLEDENRTMSPQSLSSFETGFILDGWRSKDLMWIHGGNLSR